VLFKTGVEFRQHAEGNRTVCRNVLMATDEPRDVTNIVGSPDPPLCRPAGG
jgi:hypothetical protein